MAQAIKDGSTNAISLRSVRDERGTFPDSTFSIEAVTFGFAVVALQWQVRDWMGDRMMRDINKRIQQER